MKWKFKEGAEPVDGYDGFWYELFEGGYIKPEELLEDLEDIEKIQEAGALLYEFYNRLIEEGLYIIN